MIEALCVWVLTIFLFPSTPISNRNHCTPYPQNIWTSFHTCSSLIAYQLIQRPNKKGAHTHTRTHTQSKCPVLNGNVLTTNNNMYERNSRTQITINFISQQQTAYVFCLISFPYTTEMNIINMLKKIFKQRLKSPCHCLCSFLFHPLSQVCFLQVFYQQQFQQNQRHAKFSNHPCHQ